MKSYAKSSLIYYIGYVTRRVSKYVKINSANHLYPIFIKVNGNVEEINRNKYLTLVSNESKWKQRKIKIRDLIRSITKNSDDCDKKYMKINLVQITVTSK